MDLDNAAGFLLALRSLRAFAGEFVDVLEELVKFTWMVRGRSDYLVDRYSERVESREALSKRVNQPSI